MWATTVALEELKRDIMVTPATLVTTLLLAQLVMAAVINMRLVTNSMVPIITDLSGTTHAMGSTPVI